MDALPGRDRSLLLTGPMGAGKTRVGQLLAQRLGRAFIDTDVRIEQETGASVPEIFERDGEAAFRQRERAVLAALPTRDAVIALGGGALLLNGNRELLRAKGALVWLDASPATLAERVGGDGERPLLAGLDRKARERRLAELSAARAAAYATADVRTPTDGRSPEQVRDAVLLALGWEDAA